MVNKLQMLYRLATMLYHVYYLSFSITMSYMFSARAPRKKKKRRKNIIRIPLLFAWASFDYYFTFTKTKMLLVTIEGGSGAPIYTAHTLICVSAKGNCAQSPQRSTYKFLYFIHFKHSLHWHGHCLEGHLHT